MTKRPSILEAISGATKADLDAINARIDEVRLELNSLIQAAAVLNARLGVHVPSVPRAYTGEVALEAEAVHSDRGPGRTPKNGTTWVKPNKNRFRPSDRAEEYLIEIGEAATAEAIATALTLPARSMAIALARDGRFRKMPSGAYELVARAG